MTASTELVQLSTDRGVATITLDLPHNRNALCRQLVAELRGHLDTSVAEIGTRDILLQATAPAFCAGAERKEARHCNENNEQQNSAPNPFVRILTDIWRSPKPVVGRVQGPTRAGGIGLIAGRGTRAGVCARAVAAAARREITVSARLPSRGRARNVVGKR